MSNEFKPLMVWCYACSSMVQLTAHMRWLRYCDVPVVSTDNGHVRLDLGSSDLDGEYDYICPTCGHNMFSGIQEIQDYVEKTRPSLMSLVVKCFLTDKDKMRDFVVLSKDEFLASYSYLTEEEYDATSRVLEIIRTLPEEVLSRDRREC